MFYSLRDYILSICEFPRHKLRRLNPMFHCLKVFPRESKHNVLFVLVNLLKRFYELLNIDFSVVLLTCEAIAAENGFLTVKSESVRSIRCPCALLQV